MSDAWKQWEGQVVNGEFPLTRYLGGSEHSAVFLTERHDGDRVLAAAIKLIPAVPQTSELQLYRWRLGAGLSHPHLIQLFEFGKCEIGNVPLLYVVMECAEENLAQVLSSRAITADETSVMIEPLLDALGYVHSAGFVHGHVKPTNILANGDQLKLSSDALYRSGDSVDGSRAPDAYDPPEKSPGFIPTARTMSPAGDVWSLGMTLVESLTQHLPVPQVAGQGNPPLPPDLPDPFLDIARHCLLPNPASRCTVAEIAARLKGNPFPIPQARKVPREVTGPGKVPAKVPAASVARPRRSQGARSKRPNYRAAIAVVGVLAAIVVGVSLFRHHAQVQPATVDAVETPAGSPRAQAPAPPQVSPTAPAQNSDVPAQNGSEGKQGAASTSALPAPVVATPNSRTIEPAAKALARPADGGGAVQQVLPEVPQHAKDTIQGTIKIAVKVDVDPSGTVKDAELETPGPSKYFARLALEAAQRWKFTPSGISSWTLRFQFSRAGVTVIPSQDKLP